MTALARPPLRHRLAAALALILAACAGTAAAQDAPAPDGDYRDRIIAPQALAPLPPDPEDDRDDTGDRKSVV